MLKVSDIMTRTLVTLREVDSLENADRWLDLGHIRHLPVVRGQKLVGLVTHRDLLRHGHRRRTDSTAEFLTRDVMTRDLTTVQPDTSVREAIRLMLANKFGCLPVTEADGTLVGIITESDLLKVAERYVADRDRHEASSSFGP